jgi:hypothetical protein
MLHSTASSRGHEWGKLERGEGGDQQGENDEQEQELPHMRLGDDHGWPS